MGIDMTYTSIFQDNLITISFDDLFVIKISMTADSSIIKEFLENSECDTCVNTNDIISFYKNKYNISLSEQQFDFIKTAIKKETKRYLPKFMFNKIARFIGL